MVAGLLLFLFLASLSMADLKNFGSNTFYPHYYMSMLMCILYSKYGIWEAGGTPELPWQEET